ncbi:MAG: hypothetical protein ABL953_13285 [Ilumatobacteraceae bacterium]
MATKKADLHDGAAGDQDDTDLAANTESAAGKRADSAGAALFSMDDLRARLDAPLFHRDQGLGAPAQLPRLRELTFEHAVDHTGEHPVEPVVEPALPVEEDVVVVVNETAASAPTAPAQNAPHERPKLVSFSEMMSKSAAAEPIPEVVPQASQDQESAGLGSLGPDETQALLAVLAAFETSANKLHEMGARADAAPSTVEPAPIVNLAPVAKPPIVAEPIAAEPVVAPPVVAPPVVAPPVVTPPVVMAPLVAAAPVVLESAPAEAIVAPEPAIASQAVEAELNRLAYLPDQEDAVGPVVVPTITHTEQHPVMSVPVLSQHEMYNPRAIPAPPGRRNALDVAFDIPTSSRRRTKKGVLRRAFSLIVALALLAGGLYAAKYYLLDPKWDPDVRKLVEQVEAARHLEFDHAVEVTSLTGDAYASRIASYALGISGGNDEQVAGELRALGLLTGALDLRAIGLAALPETPAFYDAGAEQIYVVSGLPVETYRFAMHRALTTALLDQEYGWGGRTKDAAPSIVRGTRALYEADALATASSMLTETDRALVLEQRPGLFATFGVLTTPSSFGTATAGRLGLSLRGFVESIPTADRGAVLNDATISDAQALDLRRLVTGVADGAALQQEVLRRDVLQNGARSQGMLFWYHVLASRLDSATAWNHALAIQLDDVVVTAGTTGYCVAALLTVTPSALDSVNATFAAWAAAAPVASTTTVVPSVIEGVARLAITACDPGVAVPTNNGLPPLTLGGAPLRSEQYRLLLVATPTLPKAQAACAVYGADNVSANDERMVVDPVGGWLAHTAHPTPDPSRSDCAAA